MTEHRESGKREGEKYVMEGGKNVLIISKN